MYIQTAPDISSWYLKSSQEGVPTAKVKKIFNFPWDTSSTGANFSQFQKLMQTYTNNFIKLNMRGIQTHPRVEKYFNNLKLVNTQTYTNLYKQL